MKCLAVNTATTILSVALTDGDNVLYHFSTAETRDQGNLIIHHAKAGLQQAGLGFADLDLLAVVTGPGSFTGIRIGLAALRGMAMAAQKPLIGLSSFDLFAAPVTGGRNIIAVESFRQELYFQIDQGAPVNETPEAFAKKVKNDGTPIVISGDAAQKLLPFLPHASVCGDLPDAITLAQRARRKFETEGEAAAAQRPAPFYLRPADVTLSSKQTRNVEGMEGV
jgi:tRNA threonylcarbamoyladenosine biosynthesis protein TsaB